MNTNYNIKISDILGLVRSKKPLVHHITNYVTASDCANIALAAGASPIMADAVEEIEDIVSLSSALVLNIGTLNKRTVESMLVAGKKANELGIPVVLDPVGAGATALRSKTTERIIEEVRLTVIRGNISEIKSISGLGRTAKGVDASEQDMIQAVSLKYGKGIAENLSSMLNCVIAITGATDIISGGGKTLFVDNGHRMLSAVTGTGCMCTTLIGACCGVTEDYLAAAAAGIAVMSIAGEKAYEKLTPDERASGSFRVKLMDSVFHFSGKDVYERGKIHEE